MLGDLEQRFSSLEEGGKSLVEQVMNFNQKNDFFLFLFHLTCILFLVQAKRLAAQQATKGWFGF